MLKSVESTSGEGFFFFFRVSQEELVKCLSEVIGSLSGMCQKSVKNKYGASWEIKGSFSGSG